MKEIIILLIVGISLSIDAFSIATCIGLYNISNKKNIFISLIVGIFHFFMPLLGIILSSKINNFMLLNNNIILGIVLIIISIQMFIEYIKPSIKNFSINKIDILLFSFGVSIDSFTIGLGLKAITNNYFLASTVFSLCSFTFTLLGLKIGKYISAFLKKYSYLFGTILLFSIGTYFICKYFIK